MAEPVPTSHLGAPVRRLSQFSVEEDPAHYHAPRRSRPVVVAMLAAVTLMALGVAVSFLPEQDPGAVRERAARAVGSADH